MGAIPLSLIQYLFDEIEKHEEWGNRGGQLLPIASNQKSQRLSSLCNSNSFALCDRPDHDGRDGES